MSAAPGWIGDLNKCREQTRWFPAKDANHLDFISDDVVDR